MKSSKSGIYMQDQSAAPNAQGKDELNRSQSSIKTNDLQNTAPKKKEVNFSEQKENESSNVKKQ